MENQKKTEEKKSFSPKRLVFRLIIIIAALVFLLGLSAYVFADMIRTQKGPHRQDVLVDIEQGAGLFAIKYLLSQKKVINHPLHLQLVVSLIAPSFSPKAGEYMIPAEASIDDIIAMLNDGVVYQRRLTIIEGARGFDVMQTINQAPFMESVLLRPPEEGSVFPDTYYYVKGTDRREFLQRMQRKMGLPLAEIWAESQAGLRLKYPEDLLILASMIEKETGIINERGLVSSVFINRLNKKMRLQSDPTVAYGLALENSLPSALSVQDLKNPHRWNTYLIPGLPATPIANPGYDALMAAAHPANSDYLYFVANGRGGHNFAKTLDAHNKNVRIYRRTLKAK